MIGYLDRFTGSVTDKGHINDSLDGQGVVFVILQVGSRLLFPPEEFFFSFHLQG